MYIIGFFLYRSKDNFTRPNPNNISQWNINPYSELILPQNNPVSTVYCPFQRVYMDGSHISCQYDNNKNCNDSNFTPDLNLSTNEYNSTNCHWSPECMNDQYNNTNTKILPCSIICPDRTITCPSSNNPVAPIGWSTN